MSTEAATTESNDTEQKWRPLDRVQRRVVGVLIEKAKTTPDNYPLSLNAVVTGSNQKSNRFPQMELDEEQADRALEELRGLGAVALIQGDGRVDKYRHLMYDWLGVDKTELAVMAELLLRGAQTLGELRSRAARMEPIADIGALRPIVDQLRNKRLLVMLTPPGRGCVVTHNLYQPQELEKVKSEHGRYSDEGAASAESHVASSSPSTSQASAAVASAVSAPPAPSATPNSEAEQLRTLREELAHVKRELVQQRDEAAAAIDEIRRELDDLKQQLGV